MSHFRTTPEGIEVELSAEERMFLGDVLPLLAEVGVSEGDPAAARLRVPVYLDDPESSEEWWRLMGQDLEAGRQADRVTFQRAVSSETPLLLSRDEADAVLRVLNEARLALGARLGIDVESDHDELPAESRQVMDYLGWIQEELTVELLRSI
ncbi:MAG TPA: DUF2017 family protein [Acidimicrobiia bacterium]|nr:DUF2017 family protein [Acidimicrobiia bacterium]